MRENLLNIRILRETKVEVTQDEKTKTINGDDCRQDGGVVWVCKYVRDVNLGKVVRLAGVDRSNTAAHQGMRWRQRIMKPSRNDIL